MTKTFRRSVLAVAAAILVQLVYATVLPLAFAQANAPAAKSAPRFSSVEDYLAKQDPTKAKTLKSIIDFILDDFPELEAKIAWNVPTIHRQGKYVLGFSAFTNHLSLNPFSSQVLVDLKPRLEKYVVKKHLFHVPVDWELDKQLLKDIVRARLAELDKLPTK